MTWRKFLMGPGSPPCWKKESSALISFWCSFNIAFGEKMQLIIMMFSESVWTCISWQAWSTAPKRWFPWLGHKEGRPLMQQKGRRTVAEEATAGEQQRRLSQHNPQASQAWEAALQTITAVERFLSVCEGLRVSFPRGQGKGTQLLTTVRCYDWFLHSFLIFNWL